MLVGNSKIDEVGKLSSHKAKSTISKARSIPRNPPKKHCVNKINIDFAQKDLFEKLNSNNEPDMIEPKANTQDHPNKATFPLFGSIGPTKIKTLF